MKKVYYLTRGGRLARRQNTLLWEPHGGNSRLLPVETVGELFLLGPVELHTSLLRFLGEKRIPLHVFSHYGHYRGSFLPKLYLLHGQVQLRQAQHALHKKKRLTLARQFVLGAMGGMQRNLAYYANRGRPLTAQLAELESYMHQAQTADSIPILMGAEGSARRVYFRGFSAILTGWAWAGRVRRPPTDPPNALLSFLNSLTYATVLGQLFHTPLSPVMGFLHSPHRGRYTLALDLAEVFKPLLADRLLFRLLNKGEIQTSDFEPAVRGIVLKPTALQKVLTAWEARLSETFHHRILKKPVSYRYLIRLEAYKLVKHIMGIHPYEPFRPWW